MKFTAEQIGFAIIAIWTGKTFEHTLYCARAEDCVAPEDREELAKLGREIYIALTKYDLTLRSERYPRHRDVKWH